MHGPADAPAPCREIPADITNGKTERSEGRERGVIKQKTERKWPRHSTAALMARDDELNTVCLFICFISCRFHTLNILLCFIKHTERTYLLFISTESLLFCCWLIPPRPSLFSYFLFGNLLPDRDWFISTTGSFVKRYQDVERWG